VGRIYPERPEAILELNHPWLKGRRRHRWNRP
jgi:hypothetical protein